MPAGVPRGRPRGNGIPQGLEKPRSVQDAHRMLEDLLASKQDFCLKQGRGYTNGLYHNLGRLRRLEEQENWLIAFISAGGEIPGTMDKQQRRIEADRNFRNSQRYVEVSEGGLDNPIFKYTFVRNVGEAHQQLAALKAPAKRIRIALAKIPKSVDWLSPPGAERRYLTQLYNRILFLQGRYAERIVELEAGKPLTPYGKMKLIHQACNLVSNITPENQDEVVTQQWSRQVLAQPPNLGIADTDMVVPLCILVAKSVKPEGLSPALKHCYAWATSQAQPYLPPQA